MKKKYIWSIVTSILFVVALVFTILVMTVDKASIGPKDSVVGFSSINKAFIDSVGYNDASYQISKYIGLLPIVLAVIYVILIVYQVFTEGKLNKVFFSLKTLFIVYVLLALIYLLFEIVVINYRPVLENDELASSFPSSHTMLSVTICGTALIINSLFVKNDYVFRKKSIYWTTQAFILVIGLIVIITRTLSGVHWITDILGGVFYGAFLVSLYYTFIQYKPENKEM